MMKFSLFTFSIAFGVRVYMDDEFETSDNKMTDEEMKAWMEKFERQWWANKRAAEAEKRRSERQPDHKNVVDRIQTLRSAASDFDHNEIQHNIGFSFDFEGSMAYQMHQKVLDIMKPEENGDFVILSIGSGYVDGASEGRAEAKWRDMYKDMNIISTDIESPIPINRQSKDALAGRLSVLKNQVFHLDAKDYDECESAVNVITEAFGVDASRIVLFNAWPDNGDAFFFKDALVNFKKLGVGHVMLASFVYSMDAFICPVIPINRDEHVPFFNMENAPVGGGVNLGQLSSIKFRMGDPRAVFDFLSSPAGQKECVLAFGKHPEQELQHYQNLIEKTHDKQDEIRAVVDDLLAYEEKLIQIEEKIFQPQHILRYAEETMERWSDLERDQLKNNVLEFFVLADLQRVELN